MSARRATAVATVLAVGLLGACSGGGGNGTAPPPSSTGSSSSSASSGPVLVALGDEVTGRLNSGEPIRTAWPQQFFRAALPRDAVFVNLATDIGTTSEARRLETPLLADLHPTVVVALLGLGDLTRRDDEDVATFAADLAGVLADVRAAGAQRVLVATLPDDGYPADFAQQTIAPYNAAIRAAVAAAHAVLVDLVPLTVSGSVRLRPPTFGVFAPDDVGEKTIAAAFTRAYRRAYPSG